MGERFNLASWLLDERLAEGKGDRVAVIAGEARTTYRDLARLVNRVGNGLLELDVDMEDRVLLALPDGLELLAAWLAAVKVGAVVVCAHPFLTTAQFERIFDVTRARTLVIDARHRAQVEEAIPSSRHMRRVITVGEPEGKEVAWEEIAQSRFDDLDPAPTHAEDHALWFASEGEAPRAVGHTHQAIARDASAARATLRLVPEDVVVCGAWHASPVGLLAGVVLPLSAGAAAVASEGAADAAAIDAAASRHGATVVATSDRPLSGRKVWVTISTRRGGATERFPGMFTESAMLCLLGRAEEGREGLSTRPVAGCEARILRADGGDVPRGEGGVLWVRREGVTPLFWHGQERTRNELRDGWIRIGSGFSLDAAGSVSYLGAPDE